MEKENYSYKILEFCAIFCVFENREKDLMNQTQITY